MQSCPRFTTSHRTVKAGPAEDAELTCCDRRMRDNSKASKLSQLASPYLRSLDSLLKAGALAILLGPGCELVVLGHHYSHQGALVAVAIHPHLLHGGCFAAPSPQTQLRAPFKGMQGS